MSLYAQTVRVILDELNEALDSVDDGSTEEFLSMLENAEQVFFIGVGRVMLSLEAISKRLAHLGIRAHVVGEITEPAITERDMLVVGSGSGESLVPVAIARKAKSLGAKLVLIGGNSKSTIAQMADLFVRIPVQTKLALPGEIVSQQPMTSLFEQSLLLYGDALAAMIIARHGIDAKKLWRCHANLE